MSDSDGLLREPSQSLDVQHHDDPSRHIIGATLLAPTTVKNLGTATVGISDAPAREDHVHGQVGVLQLIIGGNAPYFGVGTPYNPAIHKPFVYAGSHVFTGAGGTDFVITLPVTPLGFSGAWAMNGDGAAAAQIFYAILGYTNNTFSVRANAAVGVGVPVRINFGCVYWT